MTARLSLLLIALLGLSFSVQAQTFKIATLAPDGTHWMKEVRAAAKEIKQKTQGRVSFRFYPGGVMGNNKSVMRKMRIGQLHGGMITGGGIAAIYKDANLYNLPFLFQNYDEVDYVRQQMDPLLMKGLEKAGYISFGLTEGGFAYMMAANKPLRGIDDLKGLKVWIPENDQISSTTFETAGISPVQLPLTDVLTGLQTGLIDTIASSPIGAIALQWHTQVKYLTDQPLMYLYGSLIISKKHFNRLSPADQKIVRELMGRALDNINQQNRHDDKEAFVALKGQGIQFVKPNSAEVEHWHQVSEKAIVRLGQDGAYTPALLNKLRTHLKEVKRASAN